MNLRWIRLVLGLIFLLGGLTILLESSTSIGNIISIFFIIFGAILTIFEFKKETQNTKKSEKVVKKENKLAKIATILLLISVASTIVALWWGQGKGFAIFAPFVIIVPLFFISLIIYVISIFKNH